MHIGLSRVSLSWKSNTSTGMEWTWNYQGRKTKQHRSHN